MTSFKRYAVAVLATLVLVAALPARAEPMPTLVGFNRSTYNNGASSDVVVKITRIDQEPSTGDNEQFYVDCTVLGGTAVEGVDYRLVFNGAVQHLGTITIPAGVREQTFTVRALKGARTGKTLVLGLSNPKGSSPVATGENAVAKITINAPAR